MTVLQAGALIGGIGLFLLGMWLMTEGLRLAAGAALREVLARSKAVGSARTTVSRMTAAADRP